MQEIIQGEKEERYTSFYRDAIETLSDGFWVVDLSGNILEINEAYVKRSGYGREELLSMSIGDLEVSETPAETEKHMKKLIKDGHDRFETVHRTKEGLTWLAEVNASYRNVNGGLVFCFLRDITAQRQTELTLQIAEERLRLAFKATSQGWFDLDMHTGAAVVSDEYPLILGYDPAEFNPGLQTWMEALHPDDRASVVKVLKEAVESGETRTMEYRRRAKDGSWKWLRSAGKIAEYDQNGKPVRMIGTHADITEYREAQEQIRQSEHFIRNILDTVDEGFLVIDREYRIKTANKAYCKQMGGCEETLMGRYCYEVSHNTSRPCFEEGEECAVRQVFETGNPYSVMHRHRDSVGNVLYVETKAYPIKNISGEVVSAIETINNMTEKHLLEEERLKTQKLESIGTLAGGIAHDFNNLLQGVFGYISMAKMTIAQQEKALKMLGQAEEALHLSVNLTTQLLTFSKGGKPVKKLISLKPVVENAVKFALSGSHTNYELEVEPELWSVEADEGQLAQVLQNIVLNANEAMASSGTVRVLLANTELGANAVTGLLNGGQFVSIEVQDSGGGIPAQNLARIFDPYFTTKQKGSGLGLATSYSIIKNHGGIIAVKSLLNHGTTFTIYLPATPGVETEAAVLPAGVAGSRKGRVLLMDDEDLVRNVAQEMLSALGHELASAEDGRKAIELFVQAKEEGRPFDVVILDLTVKGGMGGEETIAQLRKLDPTVAAIVSSGYADSPVVANYAEYGFTSVLNKPYRLDALRKCVDSALNSRYIERC